MDDGIAKALGASYLCRLPDNARLTQELWDIILFNIDEPEKLQQILDEMYAVPPRQDA